MRRNRALTAVVGLALVVGGCSGQDGDSTTSASSTTAATSTSASSSTSDTSSTTGASSTTGTSSPSEARVRVYFSRDEAVATAGRSVAAPAVAEGALEELLDGPEGIETEIGMGSEIPEGTQLLGIDISAGTATVDLDGTFESGGGSLSMTLRVAQVVFTLTQFDTVDTVDVHIEGVDVDAIGGEGVPADDLDRSDFEDATPAVLVESPVPGQAVTSPTTIEGIARVFEGTVSYTVTDGDGLIVDEGFTTASGLEAFPPFSVTVTFDVPTPGVGSVIAYEVSARDGSQQHVYEVPVNIS